MINGLRYIRNCITEEQESQIIADIDAQAWSNELKRRVQHYGYRYDYTSRSIDESMKTADLLPWMLNFAKSLHRFFGEQPDQAIVNEYLPGQGIAMHIDCQPCFKTTIASLSLLSPCVMEFRSKEDKTIKQEIVLEPRSLLILQDEARYGWFHGIPARKTDNGTERSRRISVTFRNVIL